MDMLFFISTFLVVIILLRPVPLIKKRIALANMAILFSVFFSSVDPVVGIPLYFYIMLLSIILSLPNIQKIDLRNFFLFLILNVILLLQILNIYLRINIMPALLIGKSNTDVASIEGQLFYPTFDFTVFKHFVFFDLFLVFCLLNEDIFKKKCFWDKTFSLSKHLYCMLFIFIIVQSIIINIFGYEKEISSILQIVFSTSKTPATYMVGSFKAAQAWLIEPSGIGIVIFLYLIFIKEIRNGGIEKYDIALIILSAVAAILTTSSTGIGAFAAFVPTLLISLLITKGRSKARLATYIFSSAFLIILLTVFPNLFANSFNKITDFFTDDGSLGSAIYRMNSIKLSINVIGFSPLIGLGIGTVYAHSLIFQTVANIGVIGFALSIAIVLRSARLRNIYLLSGVLLFGFMMFTGLVEQFTSPFLIFALAALRKNTFPQKSFCLNMKGLKI